ncbi:hypothetical protein RBA71_04460 [Brenneria goodwinii]|uniref:hypothetical protein n=1 Tax=Brenneria goodwinii TaxID=1109412 RepID=UPI0036E904C8
MSIQTAFYQGELPELTLTGRELAQAGFTAGTLFRISLYRNGLVLTRLDEDTDIAALEIELLPGKMIIRAEFGVMLA